MEAPLWILWHRCIRILGKNHPGLLSKSHFLSFASHCRWICSMQSQTDIPHYGGGLNFLSCFLRRDRRHSQMSTLRILKLNIKNEVVSKTSDRPEMLFFSPQNDAVSAFPVYSDRNAYIFTLPAAHASSRASCLQYSSTAPACCWSGFLHHILRPRK